MQKSTKDFLVKVHLNTYIYTFTFMALAVGYGLKHSIGVEPMILLLGAFAFYTLSRQVKLAMAMESGTNADYKPKSQAWIRGITYFVVMLLAFTMIFV